MMTQKYQVIMLATLFSMGLQDGMKAGFFARAVRMLPQETQEALSVIRRNRMDFLSHTYRARENLVFDCRSLSFYSAAAAICLSSAEVAFSLDTKERVCSPCAKRILKVTKHFCYGLSVASGIGAFCLFAPFGTAAVGYAGILGALYHKFSDKEDEPTEQAKQEQRAKA